MIVLQFRQANLPLSTNQSNRLHWGARRALLDPWRDAAHMMARVTLGPRLREWEPRPVTVKVSLAFRTAHRRDPHNYVGTNVKAVVDGLVKAGIVPDDTADWVTVLEPACIVQPDKAEPLLATVTITPRGEADGRQDHTV